MGQSRNEMEESITEAQRAYAIGYLPEAVGYWQQGVYARMAEMLQTPTDGLHVNFCSGPGYVEAALRAKHPNIAIAGIEFNAEMLDVARGVLDFLKVQSRFHINGVLQFTNFLVDADGSPIFSWKYPLDFKDAEGFLSPGGAVEMIQADVCKEEAIQAILAGRQLDSSTYSFLGSSASNLMEASLNISTTIGDLRTKQANQWKETASAIYAQTSKHTRPGGEMVVGERQWDRNFIEDRMGRHLRYWTPDEPEQFTALSFNSNNLGDMPILLQRFVRNEMAFRA